MKEISVLSVFVLIMSCNNTADVLQQYSITTTPVKLGIGTLSTDSIQWNNIFVSKTNELYYTKNSKTGSVIKKFDFIDDKFENNQKVNFPNGSPHSDIYLNEDGDLMLFSSLMSENDKDSVSDWNIWKSVRKNTKWQTPELFFDKNIEGNQFYPWLTNSGNLYFSMTPHGSRNADLYVSILNKGIYAKPKAFPSYINTVALEGDAYVAPDESYMIFAGFERDQNLGKSDLYISFNNDGIWTTPVWLGKDINSEGYDGSPFVTHDGKYLIFTSSRGSTDENTFFNHYIISFKPEKFESKI